MSIFKGSKHQIFYYDHIAANDDAYHQAVYYLLGLTDETRNHVADIIDGDGIKPDCLSQPWQTGTTVRLCRLAFNLWNGYDDGKCTPDDIFDGSLVFFMLQGVMLRYGPSYASEWSQLAIIDTDE